MLEDDEMVSEAKVEALLSCLVPPAADESPAAGAVARAVLRRREREVQPTLQRLLMRLLTSPLTASSGLWEQSYAVVAQVGARVVASVHRGRRFKVEGVKVHRQWGPRTRELLRISCSAHGHVLEASAPRCAQDACQAPSASFGPPSSLVVPLLP
jgi:hypothetical protein